MNIIIISINNMLFFYTLKIVLFKRSYLVQSLLNHRKAMNRLTCSTKIRYTEEVTVQPWVDGCFMLHEK